MAYQIQFLNVVPMILTFLCMGGCWAKKNEIVRFDLPYAATLDNVIPVAIIGSGPAGLSAALYIARAGINGLVFAGPTPCGQLTQTTFIENWPARDKVLGADLMKSLKRQAELFGAKIVQDSVIQADFSIWPYVLTTEEGLEVKALSVIIATGATPKTLGVPGEKKFWGKGVTTCAVCDAPFFKGKHVIIVGGGDSAAEQVFELAPYVKQVTVLVRGSSMRAAQVLQDRVMSYENVAIEYNKQILGIYGDDGGVKVVEVKDVNTGIIEKKSVDGVFLAIGHIPNSQLFKKNLPLDSFGYLIMRGRTQQTLIPGVFAAGEIQDSLYRQAAVAAGEGIKAALDATSFLYELGFKDKIGKQLEKNFLETFSHEKKELLDISTLDEFMTHVMNKPGLVLVDFYKENCPGCIRMIPTLESLAHQLEGKISIVKSNTSLSRPIRYYCRDKLGLAIKSVPTIFIFKDGKFMERTNLIMSKKEMRAFVEQYL